MFQIAPMFTTIILKNHPTARKPKLVILIYSLIIKIFEFVYNCSCFSIV